MGYSLLRKIFTRVSYKIGLLIIITEFLALFALGIFYIDRFTSQIEQSLRHSFQTPAYLMSKGLLRYESVQDQEIMESLVGEPVEECIIVGANDKVYFSLNPENSDIQKSEVPFFEGYEALNREIETDHFHVTEKEGNEYFTSISPLKLEDGKFLGHLFIRAKVENANQEEKSIIFIFVLGSLLCLIVTSFVIIYFTRRYFTDKIDLALNRLSTIEKGTLPKTPLPARSDDEIGKLSKAINSLSDKLREIVLMISEGTKKVNTSSEQMDEISYKVAEGANQQASSVEEVSSTVQEISSMIEQNASNARETDKISKSAAEGINDFVKKEKESLEYIKAISEKISVINEISFQTSILALNASVEAARAGEHGKGFSVVAAEVRKLAQNSEKAANEINSLSSKSVGMTSEAHEFMMHLAPEIEKTSTLVNEISSSSEEQNSGAAQINNAIQELNTIIQEYASSAEELTKNSKIMKEEAEELRKSISYFKIEE